MRAAAFAATCIALGAAAATPQIKLCSDHSMGLASDGRVYEWGDHRGDTDFFNAFEFGYPVPFESPLTRDLTARPVSSVACGIGASFALLEDGSLIGYGFNGAILNRQFPGGPPERVSGLPPIAQVSVSRMSLPFAVALDREGQVWGWGYNLSEQLASPASPSEVLPPMRLALPTTSRIVAVSAGFVHLLLLDADGNVWLRGTERTYALNDSIVNAVFRRVEGLPPIREIHADISTSFAIDRQGSLWAWGDNSFGLLGLGLDGPLGNPSLRRTPARVELPGRVVQFATGLQSFVVLEDGSLWGWGLNENGQLGLGTAQVNEVRHPRPVRIPFPGTPRQIGAGMGNSLAIAQSGAVYGWGWNAFGRVGDGTFADRLRPSPALGEGAVGFLDLTPEDPVVVDPDRVPAIKTIVLGRPRTFASEPLSATAEVHARVEDRGKRANTYVYALAPASMAKAADGVKPLRVGSMSKAGEVVPCVLAQLTASGELRALASLSDVQAFVSDVVLGESQSVRILDGVPVAAVGQATFFAGYGSSPGDMFAAGTSRGALNAGGRGAACRPEAPETGWWWNPAEPGRGYSVEVQGSKYFFASFLYDVGGRSTWYVSTGQGVSADGAVLVGDLLAARGGQTLAGAYNGSPAISSLGPVTLAFHGSRVGTLVWPGGVVPIERFNIVPNGLAAEPRPNQPESGWWWNPDERGRGFFMEWQNGSIDLAGYMYDDAGNPVWYLALYETPNLRAMNGNWWSYANGQAMGATYKPAARISDNVAPVAITFSGADTALMALPGGRTTQLRRHRF